MKNYIVVFGFRYNERYYFYISQSFKPIDEMYEVLNYFKTDYLFFSYVNIQDTRTIMNYKRKIFIHFNYPRHKVNKFPLKYRKNMRKIKDKEIKSCFKLYKTIIQENIDCDKYQNIRNLN